MDAYRNSRKWIDKLINTREVLSREEERELIHRYCVLGETKAGEELILANQKLIMPIAWNYAKRNRGITLDDLFSEGNIGLLHALEKYDPSRQNRFMAYAKWWIRAYITRYVIQKRNIVHTSTTPTLRNVFSGFKRERHRIETKVAEEFGESPAYHIEEIERRMAEFFKVSIKTIREFEGAGTTLVRINTTGSCADENNHSNGYNPPDDSFDPIESQTKDTLAKILREEIETLEPIQRDIVKRRFNIGFDARHHDRETLAEIGLHYNMSGETIRQIEARGLRELRDKLKGRLCKGTLEELAR